MFVVSFCFLLFLLGEELRDRDGKKALDYAGRVLSTGGRATTGPGCTGDVERPATRLEAML